VLSPGNRPASDRATPRTRSRRWWYEHRVCHHTTIVVTYRMGGGGGGRFEKFDHRRFSDRSITQVSRRERVGHRDNGSFEQTSLVIGAGFMLVNSRVQGGWVAVGQKSKIGSSSVGWVRHVFAQHRLLQVNLIRAA